MEVATSQFRFLEQGNGGEAVLLLHGLFGSPSNWNTVVHDLSSEFRVYALQFPIQYEPNRSPKLYSTVRELTEYTKAFIDHVGADRVTVAGNSLGGQVAIDFCLMYPELADRLIITGSAGLFEKNLSGGEVPKVNREFIREKAGDIFYDPSILTEEMIDVIQEMLGDRSYVRYLLRIAKATRDYNVKHELEKIKIPTLIVWGEDDQITPPEVAHEFNEHLENAQLVFIDRCGHSPPMERPREFSRIMREFLENSLAPIS